MTPRKPPPPMQPWADDEDERAESRRSLSEQLDADPERWWPAERAAPARRARTLLDDLVDVDAGPPPSGEAWAEWCAYWDRRAATRRRLAGHDLLAEILRELAAAAERAANPVA